MPRKKKPAALPPPPCDSVLDTAAAVSSAENQVIDLERQLTAARGYLAAARAAHREQIRRSLDSASDQERRTAEAVAVWWEVLTADQLADRRQARAKGD